MSCSANGEMVPFSAFTTSHWVYGSPRLERYNGLPSMEIQGEAAPGTSSGDAMALMENLASKLPAGIGYDWTGMFVSGTLIGKPGSRSGSNFLCGCFPVPLLHSMKAGQFLSRLCW